jgi:hypothetical protein
MDAHDVSPIINAAKHDGPECIQPVSSRSSRAVLSVVSPHELKDITKCFGRWSTPLWMTMRPLLVLVLVLGS